MGLRGALETHGHYWAQDFEEAADRCEDAAVACGLSEQPRFAFLRGQATAYRRVAKDIRNMGASNAAIGNQMREQGDE